MVNAGSIGRPYEDEPAAYRLWLGQDAHESLIEPIGAASAARQLEDRVGG